MRGGAAIQSHTWPSPSLLCSPETSKYQDSARTTLAVANNDPVGNWTEAIFASHMSQATSGKRPLLKTNVLNGYEVLQFDGVDDALGGLMGARTNQTWVLVSRKMSAISTTTKTAFAISLNTGNRASLFTNTSFATGWGFTPTEALGVVDAGGTPTNWSIVTLTIPSVATATLRSDGGAGVVFDPHDVVGTSVSFFLGMAANATAFGDFQVAELRRYPLALTVADTNLVCGSIAKKYALAWTPAA